jgi:hypothetical protein
MAVLNEIRLIETQERKKLGKKNTSDSGRANVATVCHNEWQWPRGSGTIRRSGSTRFEWYHLACAGASITRAIHAQTQSTQNINTPAFFQPPLLSIRAISLKTPPITTIQTPFEPH